MSRSNLAPTTWSIRPHSLLSLLVFVWLLGLSSVADAKCRYPNRKVKWYTVQAGESCWSIAIKLFADGRKYRVIHKYNDLGKLPHILKPGLRLCFPSKTPDPDAKIEWQKRRVEARPPRTADWRRAQRNMALWRLYNVRTRKRSLAGIRFADKSKLAMRELSRIVIYGRSAQRIRFRALTQRTIEVKEGTIRGGLASLSALKGNKKKRQKAMIVKTPAGQVTLRSSSAQVEYSQGKKTSVVSVYQGDADVKAKGKTVNVPTNFGTYVKKGQAPAKPKPLPPAPKWEDGNRRGVAVVVDGTDKQTRFRVSWLRVMRAAFYRVEWSRRSDFAELVGGSTLRATSKTVQSFVVPRLKPHPVSNTATKSYYVRVSVRDAIGLEGRFSPTFVITVVRVKMRVKKVGKTYTSVGLLQLTPATIATKVPLEIAVDAEGKAFRPLANGLLLSKPGSYTVWLRQVGRSVKTPVQVKVLGVKGQFAKPKTQLDPAKPPLQVSFHMVDDDNNPASVPGLKFLMYPGGTPLNVGPTLQSDGKGTKVPVCGSFSATLPKFEQHPGDFVWVVAGWPGGELDRLKIPVVPRRVRGSLSGPSMIAHQRGPWPVVLQVTENKKPRAKKPKQLRLWLVPGNVELPLKADGKGKYVASLPRYKKHPGRRVWVVAEWAGGELDRKEIKVKPPPSPTFVWPEMPAMLEWASANAGLSSRAARPLSMVGLTSFVQQDTSQPVGTEREVLLRFAVRGQLALWKNRVGIDLDVPWLQVGLIGDSANINRLGDFRMGARVVAWEHPQALITPSLRVRFPTGSRAEQQLRDFGFEPGLLIAWMPHSMVHLNTNQIFVLNTDFSGPLKWLYSSTYGVMIKPLSFLSLGVELQLALGPDPSPNATDLLVGLGLGGVIRFHIDRFRIGLVGGGALNDGAQRLIGGFNVGLTFDVGFKGL